MTTLAEQAAFIVRRDAVASRTDKAMRKIPATDVMPRMKRKVPSLHLHHETIGDILEAKPLDMLRVYGLGAVGLGELYDLLDQIATEQGALKSTIPTRSATPAEEISGLIEREVALAVRIRDAVMAEGSFTPRGATILAAAILSRMPIETSSDVDSVSFLRRSDP